MIFENDGKKRAALNIESIKKNRVIAAQSTSDLDVIASLHSPQFGNTVPQPSDSVKLKSTRDSDGNSLSKAQQEYFKDSKVRDEDGNLRVVYHRTDADFTVFDSTKSRANMDIQGMFVSPWDMDAGGYGGNVKAYDLDIKNPASESTGYKALNMYKGQNEAGL